MLIHLISPQVQVLTEHCHERQAIPLWAFKCSLSCFKKGRGGRRRKDLSCQIWQLSATLMGQNYDRSLHSVSYNLIVINYERNYSSSTWVQIFLFASFIKFCVAQPIQCSTNNKYHSISTQGEFHAVWCTNIIFTWGQNTTILFQYVK